MPSSTVVLEALKKPAFNPVSQRGQKKEPTQPTQNDLDDPEIGNDLCAWALMAAGE